MPDTVKSFSGLMKSVGARQIRVIVSTADVDRVGDIVNPHGIDFTAYKTNPVILFQHDHNEPIAKCVSIGVESDQVVALIQFPEEGTSAKSDEVYALIKAGVLNAISIGFAPKSWEPIKGSRGQRFTTCEMLEASVVSVPANANALIIERKIGLTNSEAPMTKKLDSAAKTKGLYALATFASILSDLNYLEDDVEWEAEWENDGSPIPDQLAAALANLAQIFLDMAKEEIDEMLAEEKDEKALAAGALIKKLRAKAVMVPTDANGGPLQPAVPGGGSEVDAGLNTPAAPAAADAPIPTPIACPHCGGDITACFKPKGFDGAVTKAGRVLSNANYDKLKAAQGHINDVVASHEASLAPDVPADANGSDPIPAVPKEETSLIITNSFQMRAREIELLRLKG